MVALPKKTMKHLLFYAFDPIASAAISFATLTKTGVYSLLAQIPNPTAEAVASGGSTAVLAGVVWLIAVKFQGGQDMIVAELRGLPANIAKAMKDDE